MNPVEWLLYAAAFNLIVDGRSLPTHGKTDIAARLVNYIGAQLSTGLYSRTFCFSAKEKYRRGARREDIKDDSYGFESR